MLFRFKTKRSLVPKKGRLPSTLSEESSTVFRYVDKHGSSRANKFLLQVVFKVTSVTGHVFSCDFPQEYQNWNSTDPVDLFAAPTKRVPQGKGILRLLQNESKGCDYLVLWLDCDREGENICFEVIDCVKCK